MLHQLQRSAGNAAVGSLLRGGGSGAGPAVTIQRSIVDEALGANQANFLMTLSQLNPKDEATNLWVRVDGRKLSEHPVASQVSDMVSQGKWPIQSRGQGMHAEESFVHVWMPQLAAAGVKHVSFEINKTPCETCTPLVSALPGKYPGITFDLSMLGFYPGGQRGGATSADDLVTLEGTLGARLLDLSVIAQRLAGETFNRGDLRRAQSFVTSMRNALQEAVDRLGQRSGETRYGSELAQLKKAFDDLELRGADQRQGRKVGGRLPERGVGGSTTESKTYAPMSEKKKPFGFTPYGPKPRRVTEEGTSPTRVPAYAHSSPLVSEPLTTYPSTSGSGHHPREQDTSQYRGGTTGQTTDPEPTSQPAAQPHTISVTDQSTWATVSRDVPDLTFHSRHDGYDYYWSAHWYVWYAVDSRLTAEGGNIPAEGGNNVRNEKSDNT